MEDTLNYLYPHMPQLLESGMSRGQATPLLSLRSSAMKVWKSFSGDVNPECSLDDVFGAVCRCFDEPESYALDIFRDEFIGQLVKALPHPSLNYDRWLIELDPREQNAGNSLASHLHCQHLHLRLNSQVGGSAQHHQLRPCLQINHPSPCYWSA